MGHPEGCDAEDLNLPGLQPQLVEAILETGTPTVLLAVSGRPYALGQYQGRAAARWPECFLAGSIPPASCRSGYLARPEGSRTRTWPHLSDSAASG